MTGRGPRLTAMRLIEARLPLRFAFRHASMARSESHVLFVVLQGEDGSGRALSGHGECLPRAYVSGETIESCWETLTSVWWPAFRGVEWPAGREGPAALLEALTPHARRAHELRATASFAGVDVALFDLWGRHARRPGRTLLGEEPAARIPLVAPVGLGGRRELAARAFRLAGLRSFKVKAAAGDAGAVVAMRRLLGRDVELTVDYNEALTYDEARRSFAAWSEAGVAAVEQPLPAAATAELMALARESPAPIMLDESLVTLADADRWLGKSGRVQWNLRLGKNGGFSGTRLLVERAREAGIAWQLGVLVGETEILDAAGRAALALGRPLRAESSFPRLLLGGRYVRGAAPLLPRPWRGPLGSAEGLGVALDEGALKPCVVRERTLG